MVLPAIDKFLIGKKIGDYALELEPKDAFGLRDPSKVKTFPASVFKNQKINPYPGAVFYFDNLVGKVSSVSGGRVTVDFNNPLAGKPVIYEIKVKNQVKEINEKAKALIVFFARKEFKFEIKEKKLIIEATKKEGMILKFFAKKFKETLNLDLEIKEKPDEKPAPEKPNQTK
jgi:FKBP-type peptidyl-prolyl cis-trans isomerase 2